MHLHSNIVILTMSSLKKMYSFVSDNRHSPHPCASFFKLCYSVSEKTFFKDIYVIWMKKNGNFFHFSVLWFFTKLLLSILYKQLSCSFQLPKVLDCYFS